jgi:hypothetical protein
MRTGGSWAAVLALALVCGSTARAADVDGKWETEFQSPVGPQKYTFDLQAAGEKLTGKATFERMGQKGMADLLEGKLMGSDISFVEMVDAMGQKLRVVYTGKVAGDEMKLTRKVGDNMGQQELVLKRVKAATTP